ncbi:hypothetical protein [Rhodococcoides fascians]|uniref:hypothetical protein n=1 Tax=Rhodococcoides fascians TaxID=1828 RepID=UPI00050C1119|nr:hypothetical protein [Rhodococcus fascians]
MDSEAASAVVDLAISHAFVDWMDVVAAELSLLGWTPEATDGDGTFIDQQWEYPPSHNLWRIHNLPRFNSLCKTWEVVAPDRKQSLFEPRSPGREA